MNSSLAVGQTGSPNADQQVWGLHFCSYQPVPGGVTLVFVCLCRGFVLINYSMLILVVLRQLVSFLRVL